MRGQIELTIQIHKNCVDLNFNILKDINEEHLIWKPGSDSRSIAEIARHLVRVDNMLLAKIKIEANVQDTFSNEQNLISEKLIAQRDYIISLARSSKDDDDFRQIIKREGGTDISLRSTLIHIIHHHLYHYAQMVYLRRVNDRKWEPPLKKWESTVDLVAEF